MRTVRNVFTLPALPKAFQLGVLAFLSLSGVSAWAQVPANDNFANAAIISGIAGQVLGSNTNASLEVGEPALVSTTTGIALQGSTVWYQWTAPSSGNVTFDTIGSSFDTVLRVATGSAVDSLTDVAGDDDSGGNLT